MHCVYVFVAMQVHSLAGTQLFIPLHGFANIYTVNICLGKIVDMSL